MLKTSFAVFTAGFALFAMFFGSGNLVFPLMVGVTTGPDFLTGSFGLIITGVIVPFIGLISIIAYQSSPKQYFDRLGKPVSFAIILIMLSLLGPFGVCPRCILVAYGGLSLIFESLSLVWFSLIFTIIGCIFIYYDSFIIPLIGKYLTPILLGAIICVIGFGVYYSTAITAAPMDGSAFVAGLNLGYQPMDLLAAFFFAASISNYLSNQNHTHMHFSLQTLGLLSSIIGITLLALVYFYFVTLGASYADVISTVAPEQMLAKIAQITLGKAALPVIAGLVFLACLTTFMILMDLFATFLHEEILRKKFPVLVSIIFTGVAAFAISLLGFGELANFLANLLFFIYPALIVFAVFSLIDSIFKINLVKPAFYLTIAVIAISKLILL